MPSHRLQDEKVQELTGLVEGWGKLLAEEAYGPDGPGLDVDLAGMEELAVTMQQALLSGLCEELTQRQAGRLPGTQACPECGDECELPSPDDSTGQELEESSGEAKKARRMRLRGGTFELTEPRCYCRRCRRSFFPSADGSAD